MSSMKAAKPLLLSFILSCCVSGRDSVSAASLEVQANTAAEITFTASTTPADPFNHVTLDAVFTDPAGHTFRVPAFWAGGNVWKVRYSSPLTGTHRFHTECDPKDLGLDHINGELKITRYRGANPLFRRGPVRVAPDHRHFEYADGTPFFWLGDTWWMGLCHRIHWPDEFKTLTTDRKAKGFNVIQIVAGLYPDMPPFDPRGANEAGYPWGTNYSIIRPEYFDAADKRLQHLIDAGFTPCLVGAWGYFIPWMGVEKSKQHWRYLVARYGAWPMIWCAAGEANLPYYLEKGFPFDSREQVKQWSEVMHYIREIDPFHRPLSIHPTGMGRLSARGAVTDQALLDFDMLQTGHGLREILAPSVKALRDSCADTPAMPVLNSEVCFEQLGGTIPADIPRLIFWASMLNGAAGHTYGANGIWQCNRRDQPHGKSPHGGSWGDIPWDDAMKLPGARQVGAGKQFLESFGWGCFESQSDSVKWADASPAVTWGKWIWFPEGDPKTDAPTERRYFRRKFDLPSPNGALRARLTISADNKFRAWINGKEVGSGADWHTPDKFEVGSFLKPGPNVLAVRAQNEASAVPHNPAGLMVSLEVEHSARSNLRVLSDASWRVSKSAPEKWQELSFDDGGWENAKALTEYGGDPWGKIERDDPAIVPFAAGIADRIRVIYSPDPRSVQVSHLRPAGKYRITRFDPATCTRTRESAVAADDRGTLKLQPAGSALDWAVALELR